VERDNSRIGAYHPGQTSEKIHTLGDKNAKKKLKLYLLGLDGGGLRGLRGERVGLRLRLRLRLGGGGLSDRPMSESHMRETFGA
jgi:hypothetical protein